MRNTLGIGSISEGTTDAADIAKALVYDLDRLRLTRAHRKAVRAIAAALAENTERCDESAGELLEELTDIGQNYVPDYCTLGMHAGDGADFGVWPDYESVQFDGLVAHCPEGKYPSEYNPPFRYSHAVFTNDHGNQTMYRRVGVRNQWREVWSVV